MPNDTTYPAYHIKVLESWEAIRKRPSMYTNLADPHLPVTLVRQAWVEARRHGAAGARLVKIEAFPGGVIAIWDDGVGWDSLLTPGLLRTPVRTGRELEDVMDPQNWVNLSLVTLVALSHEFRITTHHGGRAWSQQFLSGQAITPYEDQGPSTLRGSLITLTLDKALLPRVEFEALPLRAFADELRADGLQVELREP